MSSTTGKRSSALGTAGFMVAAVVFSALAGVMLSQVLQSRYSTEPVSSMVVARKNLKAGAPLHAGDLTLADWPQSSVPAGAFRAVADVLKTKSVPLVLLVRGEPVLRSHLSKPNTGIGMAGKIEPGKRAVSIRTDDPVALARLLYPGARVDVLSTVRRHDAQQGQQLSTRTVLQNIKVLAVGEDIDPMTSARRRERASEEEEGSGGAFGSGQADSREVRGVVTLLVTPPEAEKLSRAARQGKIDIALRNPQDKSITKLKPELVAAAPVKPPPAVPQVAPADERRWGLKLRRSRRARRKRKRNLLSSGGSGIRIVQGSQ